MHINEYLQLSKAIQRIRAASGACRSPVVPHVQCADGFSMSVQAGDGYFCDLSEHDKGAFATVEVSMPNMVVIELLPYCTNLADLYSASYENVPVEIVDRIISRHGGIKNRPGVVSLAGNIGVDFVRRCYRVVTAMAA